MDARPPPLPPSLSSPSSLLLPLLLVTASSGPGVCVFLEDTRAHASR